MDCIICSNSLLSNLKTVSTTLCGHIYHHDCLKHWFSTKPGQRSCPICNEKVDINKNIILYINGGDVLSPESLQALQKKIDDITTNLERQNNTMTGAFSQVMIMLEDQNKQLRNDKKDLMELLKNSGESPMNASKSDDQIKEQLRVKETLITNLRKEVHELKLQRAEAARSILEIQNQVKELKENKRDPLAPKNEQKPIMSLSLKFDDFATIDRADRLIFDD